MEQYSIQGVYKRSNYKADAPGKERIETITCYEVRLSRSYLNDLGPSRAHTGIGQLGGKVRTVWSHAQPRK